MPPAAPLASPLPQLTPHLRSIVERAISQRGTPSLRDADPAWDTIVGRALERWPGDDVHNDLIRVMRGHGRVAGWDRRRAEIIVPTLDPSLPRPIARWHPPHPSPIHVVSPTPSSAPPPQPPPSPQPSATAPSPPSQQPSASPSRLARAVAAVRALAHTLLGAWVPFSGLLSLGRIIHPMDVSGRPPHQPHPPVRQNK